MTSFNPPLPLPLAIKLVKTHQLVTDTTFLSILQLLYVRLSVCLKHQHCNAALQVRRAVMALSIITACIIEHSIMAALEIK